MTISDNKIDVLDHGFVRLVSYTQPAPVIQESGFGWTEATLTSLEGWTGDLEIVRNARVSHNSDWRPSGAGSKNDNKLIAYLMNNQHTSPFEAMVMTFEIQAPIFVVRQWHRHRTWSYNEVSARYTELPELYYVPDPELIGRQSTKNHQSRDIDVDVDKVSKSHSHWMATHNGVAFAVYHELLNEGCPRELARSVLPLSTYTRFFGTVNLHNLFRFIGLRLHPHAQYEIQQYAKALLTLAEKVCPVAVECFVDMTRVEREAP